MNEQDKMISKLYKETYGNVHASEDLKGKVMNMSNKKNRKAKVIKLVCAIAAATMAVTIGAMAVSASRTQQYDKVYVNGEEKMARFLDYGINTRLWECEANGFCYSVFVHGDFDTEKDTLYFVDYGDYFLASTDPNPTLNLYQEIDKSSFAKIREEDGETYLDVTDDAGTMQICLTNDKNDGAADGKIPNPDSEGTSETYSLLPNGAVVNTIKYEYTPVLDDIMRLFGQDRNSFWNHLHEEVDSNQQNG